MCHIKGQRWVSENETPLPILILVRNDRVGYRPLCVLLTYNKFSLAVETRNWNQ